MQYLILAFAYLIGSFPTAYIAGQLLLGNDIRNLGDGNMGAQNVARVISLKAGIPVFVIDAAKGAVPVLIARAHGADLPLVMLTGAFAMIGHNWPIFIGFRGGRGEATSFGILMALAPRPIIITGTIALIIIYKTQKVILGSAFLYILLFPLYRLMHVPGSIAAYTLGLALLVAVTHFLRVRNATLPVR